MRMKVICGDPDCREEFHVDTKDPVWECPECSRKIINRNYPFLTARLMQARIDGDSANWKKRYSELIEEARTEFAGRDVTDLSIIEDAERELSEDHSNSEWRELHDKLLETARDRVLETES